MEVVRDRAGVQRAGVVWEHPDAARVACERPNLLRCEGCGAERVARCGTTRSASCSPCGTAHRGRVRLVAQSGLVVGRRGLFVTVTAPGVQRHRKRNGQWCPCTPYREPDENPERPRWLSEWNASASARFNRLMQDIRRTVGDDVQYFRATEPQRRGALHYHLILRRSDGRPLALRKSVLRRLAMKHGFGHAVDVQRVQEHHAGYVAKYVSKASDDRYKVPWYGVRHRTTRTVDPRTGEIRDVRREVYSGVPTYRPWSASRGYGDPMKHVRAAQAHYSEVVRILPAWSVTSEGARLSAGLAAVPVRPDVPPGDPPD